MKKANIKTKTIIWLILAIIAFILLIIFAVVLHNTIQVLKLSEFISFDKDYLHEAMSQYSFAIAIITFSSIIILIGTYISYAGFKSWKYNATI